MANPTVPQGLERDLKACDIMVCFRLRDATATKVQLSTSGCPACRGAHRLELRPPYLAIVESEAKNGKEGVDVIPIDDMEMIIARGLDRNHDLAAPHRYAVWYRDVEGRLVRLPR